MPQINARPIAAAIRPLFQYPVNCVITGRVTVSARLDHIALAIPAHDIHRAFVGWAEQRLEDRRERALFGRMAARSGISHRWSVLPRAADGGSPVAAGGLYEAGFMPPTSQRMALYTEHAPALAEQAVRAMGDGFDPDAVTHLVVASCTGFAAPGVDQLLAARLGLSPGIERTLIGFMGCYAAVIALRTARHIVRSDPDAVVLVVTVELSTLHLQPEVRIEPLLAMLQFGDGAAATLIRADRGMLEIGPGFAATLDDSAGLIEWRIGDTGFAMHLSGEVPGRLSRALAGADLRTAIAGNHDPADIPLWAVHAGGRSILDAVEDGLGLPADALDHGRGVLNDYGNMSSVTLMAILARQLASGQAGDGVAMAFGPGVAAEGFRFELTR